MSSQGISAQELAQKLIRHEPIFILDVRNKEAFADWRIEGKGVRVINHPYFELLDGIEPIVNELPEDQEIVVVCAQEGSSQFVADQIVEAGFANVFYLKDGMRSWSEHLEPVKVGELTGSGALYQFVRLGKGCLSYAIVSDGEAVIVDPNRMTDVYEQFAKEKGFVIRHIVDTHLHADHISGGRHLAAKTGADYWLPPEDAGEVTFAYHPLTDKTVLDFGRNAVTVEAMYSPGHTIGSTSLIVDDHYLLTGDILFVESIGRPDLAGKANEWVDDLRHTLYGRYRELSDGLIVLPAHYGQVDELNEDGSVHAQLGELYKKNKGLNIESDTEFRQTVTENLPPQPNAFQDIRQVNMGKITPDVEGQSEMEIGPNRCAVHG